MTGIDFRYFVPSKLPDINRQKVYYDLLCYQHCPTIRKYRDKISLKNIETGTKIMGLHKLNFY